MRTDRPYMPDTVRDHFTSRGYSLLREEHPDFGGIIFYLQREGGNPEVAYYISKPSAIELVTTDELRRILDFLEERCIQLRHFVTASALSPATSELVWKNEIRLWELQSRCVEIPRRVVEHARIKRLKLHTWLRGTVL
jgi:hypothetical protein